MSPEEYSEPLSEERITPPFGLETLGKSVCVNAARGGMVPERFEHNRSYWNAADYLLTG